jgi:hypothetical protein
MRARLPIVTQRLVPRAAALLAGAARFSVRSWRRDMADDRKQKGGRGKLGEGRLASTPILRTGRWRIQAVRASGFAAMTYSDYCDWT